MVASLRDPRIRYAWAPNVGYPAPVRNRGIRKATGDQVIHGRIRWKALWNEDRQVEPRLVRGVVARLRVEAEIDEQIGTDAQDKRCQSHQREQRRRQPGPDASHVPPRPYRAAL